MPTPINWVDPLGLSACPPDDKSASKLDHLADQWKTENTPPDVTNSGRKFWTSSTTFKGNKVFHRNDLIDPKLVDARGRTNLERMQKGLAPAGLDGKVS